MSRIGRMPITIPSNVTVDYDGKVIAVKGPLGEIKKEITSDVKVEVKDGVITLDRTNEEKPVKARHGLFRAVISNMIKGVTEGYTRYLVFNGVGYKISKNGNKLMMDIGLSHTKTFEDVPGVTVEVVSANDPIVKTIEKGTIVAVKGIDKELVGQVAASIRSIKPVEPYHMYGIRFIDEYVIRKVSKNGKK